MFVNILKKWFVVIPLFEGEVALTCIDHLTDEQCKEVFKDLQSTDWEYVIDGLAKYTL